MVDDKVEVEEEEIEQGEQVEMPDGFITKEEWEAKGRDPEKWRDPKEFKKRGEEILPIVKANLDKTQKELLALKSDMDKVLTYTKKQEERVRKEERDKIIAEYESKKKEAFENDDLKALTSAEQERDKKIQELDKEPEEAKTTVEDPVFTKWKDKNKWYATDTEMKGWADETGVAVLNAEMAKGKSFEEALEEVTVLTKAKFAHKLENPNRDKASAVEGEASAKSKRGNGAKWDNIEKQHQDSFFRTKEQMKLKGLDYKKEDFVRDYFS